MEKFKFALLSIIIVACMAIVGYWAFMTIEPGDAHYYKEKQEELAEKNRALAEEAAKLKSELSVLKSEQEKTAEPAPEPTKPVEKPPATPAYKYQTLINELQKLIDDNVFMKVGSKGTRVGTIQTFLNIYNKTSKRVDNDYGTGLKTDVMNFQKAVGTTADGETGPATYRKMIDWLKKQ